MTEDLPATPAPESAAPAASSALAAPAPAPAAAPPMLESEARTFAMLINLVAVLGAVFSAGTLSLVGVLVMWLMKRDRSALVDFHGKQQLNLAITLLIVWTAVGVGTLLTFFIGGFLLIPAAIGYSIWTVIASIIAAVKSNEGQYYRIALVVPFIK